MHDDALALAAHAESHYQASIERRRQAVVSARNAGATFREIAAAMNRPIGSVFNDWKTARTAAVASRRSAA